MILGDRQSAQRDYALRRLLRNFRTGAYFVDGRWTLNAAEAQVFSSTKAAIDLTLEQHLENVEVVLQFGPEPSAVYDCRLPLEFSHVEYAA